MYKICNFIIENTKMNTFNNIFEQVEVHVGRYIFGLTSFQ